MVTLCFMYIRDVVFHTLLIKNSGTHREQRSFDDNIRPGDITPIYLMMSRLGKLDVLVWNLLHFSLITEAAGRAWRSSRSGRTSKEQTILSFSSRLRRNILPISCGMLFNWLLVSEEVRTFKRQS